MAVWGSYRHPSGVFLSADASYKSSFFATSDLNNTKNLQIPGYTLVNLRVGYETDHWSAIVFCNNLFDRQYILGRDLNSNANAGSAYVGDPRLVGMTLSARF